jgi:hypothetical protein
LKREAKLKLICKGNHWEIKDGQLILDTPDGQQTVKNMVSVLESQIRNTIYEEIIALDFTQNRKQIMKYGIENALLTVQDACAKVIMKGQS